MVFQTGHTFADGGVLFVGGKQRQKFLVSGFLRVHHRAESRLTGLLDQARRVGVGLFGQRCFGRVDGLGSRLQLFQAKGDGLVKHGGNHVVAGLGQVGVELHFGPLGDLERVGIARRGFATHGFGGQDGQARNLGVVEQLLTLLRHGVADELASLGGIFAATDQGDVGRHHGRHIGVYKLHRKARVLARQAKKVNHQTDAELPVVDPIGHAKTAFGDRCTVA